MTTVGKPEQTLKRLGEEIARLRTRKGWARSKLVHHLSDELALDDPTLDVIGEAWLARFERGEIVKVSRQTIEALCRALQCTPRERVRLLLYADRNVFEEPSPVKEVLSYALDELHTKASDILASLVGQRQAIGLDDKELFEIIATALEVVIADQQQN